MERTWPNNIWPCGYLVRPWLTRASCGIMTDNIVVLSLIACMRSHTAMINRADFGECDLMVHPRKYSIIFSLMHFVTFIRK